MSELPLMRLQLAGEEFEATPDNTSLYRHLGAASLYDHVFLQKSDEESGVVTGSYIFSHLQEFEEIEQFMVQNGFPLHVNLRAAAESDVKAYEMMISNNLEDIDTVPEWLAHSD